MSEDGDVEYGLVMPFVVCQSQGGPYEDEAFVVGWALGQLDIELGQAAAERRPLLNRSVRPAALPQVELLAMKHGFLTAAEVFEDAPDEWSVVQFLIPAMEEV